MSPTAFGSSYAAETSRTLAEIIAVLQTTANSPTGVFGAFVDDRLVGIAALACTTAEKVAHNGTVWGMYVTPAFRQRGVSQSLLDAIISHARTFPHIRNLKLGVNASNAAAISLYQSRGFIRYGLERDALWVDGIFYDSELYALPLKHKD